MVQTRISSQSLTAFFLAFAFGNVSAYAPSRISRGVLTSPSFLTLPRAKMETSVPSRCRPILFASDPEAPLQEALDSSSSSSESETSIKSSAPEATSSENDGIDFGISGLGIKIALGVVAAFTAYQVASLAIVTTTEFFNSLAASIQGNFWGFLASLPENLLGLAASIFGFLKVFLPAVGEFGKSAYEVASPIVSETSQRAIEVAAPVLQDTAEKVADVAGPLLEEATKTANEAAAPYVDQLNAAVGTSIVAPIQDAKNAVGDAVDAQIQGATQSIDAQIQGATQSIDAQIQGATKSMGDALDTQFKKFFP